MTTKRDPYFKGLGKKKPKAWVLTGDMKRLKLMRHGNIERSMDKEFAKLKA